MILICKGLFINHVMGEGGRGGMGNNQTRITGGEGGGPILYHEINEWPHKVHLHMVSMSVPCLTMFCTYNLHTNII